MIKVEIPYEVADAITLASLKETKNNIVENLYEHYLGEEGRVQYHEEDVEMFIEIVSNINEVIRYYGDFY
jgi:hypothetical protein